MKVNILVTIPDPELFDACTLCFDTIRVGFPTADIHVNVNLELSDYTVFPRLNEKVRKAGATCSTVERIHHATWIRHVIEEHRPADGPCIILDSDTIFWSSCEDWKFETPIAGYYVPVIWNDFAQCVSFERLHTSLLWISDSDKLLHSLFRAYPNSEQETGDYCPVDPFMPRVQFIKGQPFFWDSTAALYNMVGGTHFSAAHKACFEHLNSASFYKVMHERLDNKAGFELLHKQLVKTPEKLRGWWGMVDAYYGEKHQQALAHLKSLESGIPSLRTLAPVLG